MIPQDQLIHFLSFPFSPLIQFCVNWSLHKNSSFVLDCKKSRIFKTYKSTEKMNGLFLNYYTVCKFKIVEGTYFLFSKFLNFFVFSFSSKLDNHWNTFLRKIIYVEHFCFLFFQIYKSVPKLIKTDGHWISCKLLIRAFPRLYGSETINSRAKYSSLILQKDLLFFN